MKKNNIIIVFLCFVLCAKCYAKRINYTRNYITDIPDSVLTLNVDTLILIGTHNLDYAQAFKKLSKIKSLTYLDLTGSNLHTLPNEIGLLTQLITLKLRNTKLTYLPLTFRNLKNLEYLDLSANELKIDPTLDILKNIKNLKFLDLGHNKIDHLPKSIACFKNLEVLCLDDNFLEEIPVEIYELSKLKVLYLDGNKLKKLPKSLEKLVNLKILSILGNRFTEESVQEIQNMKDVILIVNNPPLGSVQQDTCGNNNKR